MSLTYSLVVPPKGGILLNARHYHHHSPRHLVSPPSPSGSSSDSSDAPTTKPNRRITFAPLPRPRTFVNQDGETVPVIVFNDSLDGAKLIYDDPEASSSLSGDDGNSLPVSVSNASLNRTSSRDSMSKSSSPSTSSWSKKLFSKPFYKLKKTQASDESTGINLFRASSRDSTTSAASFTDGSPLTRRMSTGSAQPSVSPSFGYPLTTVASENGGAVRQTRMLNGRVYGGQRNRQITSLPTKEDAEPEFVEWGYGGMGSRSAAGSSVYAGVQSSQKNAVAGAEEDDGSGMGWVQRRRAQRERERQEREAKEAEEDKVKQDDATKSDTPNESASNALHIHKEDDSASVATAKVTDNAGTPPTPRPHTPSSHPQPSSHAMTDEEHITRAIKVPPHKLRPTSRQSSIDQRPSSSGSATPTVTSPGRATPMRKSSDSSHVAASINIPPTSSLRLRSDEDDRVSEEEDSSSSEDVEDSGADRETEEDDDDEDDDEELVKSRMTSLCAGVEKISRHKD
ncbi:hypothetical protein FRC03_010234 [Tulasnella sp. 419]|nr:hypothetical protein FRC03_010234 [Tulasnella sp. 419]